MDNIILHDYCRNYIFYYAICTIIHKYIKYLDYIRSVYKYHNVKYISLVSLVLKKQENIWC